MKAAGNPDPLQSVLMAALGLVLSLCVCAAAFFMLAPVQASRELTASSILFLRVAATLGFAAVSAIVFGSLLGLLSRWYSPRTLGASFGYGAVAGIAMCFVALLARVVSGPSASSSLPLAVFRLFAPGAFAAAVALGLSRLGSGLLRRAGA